jgi:hypothetical protein
VESLDRSTGWVMNGIIAVSSLAILLFAALPGPVIDSAAAAAASLFPG